MRVEKINANTLRVSMTREDLANRGLRILDLLGNKNRVQDFFMSVLKEVDKDNSFTTGEPVTFQVMPNDGGIDLLITKLKDSPDMQDSIRKMFGQDYDDTDYSKKLDDERPFFDLNPDDDINTEMDPVIMHDLEIDDKTDSESYWNFQKNHCYRFDDIDNVAALADALKVSDLASSVYYYDGKFYLELAFMDENYAEIKPADAWAIANEFGYQVSKDNMQDAKERGKCVLRQDALGYLRRNFSINKF